MVKGCMTVVAVFILVVVIVAYRGGTTRRAGQLTSGDYPDGEANASLSVPRTEPVSVLKVSAFKLYMDYHANELSADNTYKGRLLSVRGMVTEIRKDFVDDAVIELASTNEFEQVSAYLEKSEEGRAASVRKYSVVTLLCEGAGLTMGSPMLRNCKFEEEDHVLPETSASKPIAAVTPLADPDENGVYHLGRGLEPPEALFTPEPEYTDEAKQQKISGTVLVGLIVNANGEPEKIHVLRSLGAGLDEKAVEAVSHYTFKPATFQGKAVPIAMNISVNFQIF